MTKRRRLLIGILLGVLLSGSVLAQPINTQIAIAINSLVTGVTPFTAFRTAASSYLNWGVTQGVNGYGVRDNAGTMEMKNSGGAWTVVVGGSGLPANASFWTRIPEAALSNETPLSALATALIVNTTASGVPTAYAGTSCTNQFPRALSAIGIATCATVDLNLDTTGTIGVSRGGTGLTIGTSGGVLGFTGPTTYASSVALTASAIVLGGGAGATPTPLASLGTTTTLLHGNAAGAPTFGAVSLTADVSGILPSTNGGTANAFFTVSGPAGTIKTFTFPNANATILTTATVISAAQGGTGLSTYAVGDLIQATAVTPTLGRLAAVSTGNALISGGVNTISAWGKIGLTTHVSGTLPAANGGTGLASYTTGDLIVASSATTLASLADVAAGRFVRSGGVGVAPTYSTTVWTNTATTGDLLFASAANTYSNLADVAVGSYLRAGGIGVAPLWSTATLPNTATTGDVIYASAANAYANLASVAVGSYLRAGGVGTAPLWSTVTLPNAATTGDLISASGANAYANITAVAVGQVLTSNGVGALPVWSASPLVTAINIGGTPITQPSDGVLRMTNAAVTSFSRLLFGPDSTLHDVGTISLPFGASISTKMSVTDSAIVTYNRDLTGMTDAASNDLFSVSIPNAAGHHLGGKIQWTVMADDGTDFQARTGSTNWTAVRSGATYDSDIQTLIETVSVTAGTLTATFAITAAAGVATVAVTPTSSLVPTTLKILYSTEFYFDADEGVTFF